ncbi:hypothetical protein [Mesorhizobium xinjiangense]|uniref:hypothetical protein n=1 Tax=Mesorhizobium xinjiangense TaxID=2678685 RepID=UPI0012EE336A|nr:hypothetical protein [Mesorhizobium xinjiangense]
MDSPFDPDDDPHLDFAKPGRTKARENAALKFDLDRVRPTIDAAINPPPADAAPAGEEFEAALPTGIRALGFDEGTFFYWSERQEQIVDIRGAAHSKQTLMNLAPLSYWEVNFPGRRGCDWDAAANAMLRKCEDQGVFDPSRKVGRGVLLEDDGSVVAHLGDRLVVDGREASLCLPGSKWIFQKRTRLNITKAEPLKDDEARQLCHILESLSWATPDMGRLLAGWLTIAPICGALETRPHLWITGERGSGKSYVMDEIAGRLLGNTALNVQSDTTEAGVRQVLKGDLLPVLFDEFEAKTEDDRRRVAKVIGLARQAFSANGAPIVKGSAGGASATYRVRSTFLFASIDKSMTLPADESRIITLELRGTDPNASAEIRRDRAERFARLQREIDDLLANNFGDRLFWRTLGLVDVINANAETFATAIAKRTGNRRLGDTLGAPLAGWLSLYTSKRIDAETAEARLQSWKWLGEAISRGQTAADHDAAYTHLMQSSVLLDGGIRRTIGEMIDAVVARDPDFAESYHKALLRYGIRVDVPDEPGGGAGILVSNTHPSLRSIFHGMPFQVATLKQHPAATAFEKTVRFDSRDKVRCLRIDLEAAGHGESD